MAIRRLLAELVDLVLATALAAFVSVFVATTQLGPRWSWQTTNRNYLGLFLVALACVLATLPLALAWHHAEPTPGYRIFGLKIRDVRSRGVLSRGAALARWIVVFAPITLWVYPLMFRAVFDPPAMLLILFSHPAWLDAMVLLPAAWYLLLAVSIVRSPDGRGWHDRVSGAVVVAPKERSAAASV